MVKQHTKFISLISLICLLGSPALSTPMKQVKQATGSSIGGDTAFFRGEADYSVRNDTVIVRFTVIPYNFDADSVEMWIRDLGYDDGTMPDVEGYNPIDNSFTLYLRTDSIPSENSWRSVRRRGNLTEIKGELPIALNGADPSKWTVYFRAVHYVNDTSYQSITDFVNLYDFYAGLGSEIFVLSYGYFDSEMDPPFDKKGPFLAWGISMEFGVKRWRFMLSTSWSGLGGNFRLSEPVRLATRFYSGTRTNFLPQFYAAFKQSELKLKRDDFEYNEKPWGGEFGLAFEGPFERLGYHYSTAFGGYHTVELFLSTVSARTYRFGTRFQFLKYEDLWAVKVGVHIEGWFVEYDHYIDMTRYNNRPLPHKILALAGLAPYVIISIPYNLVTGKPVLGK